MTAPDWPYGWLFHLAQAATRDEASRIAEKALARGANPANVAAALVEWNLRAEEDVHVIGRGGS